MIVELLSSILMIFAFVIFLAKAARYARANEVWPRPSLITLPDEVFGTSHSVISLNGKWKFTMNPPGEFWLSSADPSDWPEIFVPGECFMQGFDIESDREYPYKRLVDIPADFSGKRIILRFEGVYSYARVWVNGAFIRDHNGGFTAFDCDITDHVEPGRSAWITVGVTDRSDDISHGSGYAKHKIGGILRNVKLVALPKDHIIRFHALTDFDSSYKDFFLFGNDDPGDRGSNDFRSRKENIYYASAIMEGSGHRVRVESDSSAAVKMEYPNTEKKDRISMLINNEWSYKDLDWGNYMNPATMPQEYTNTFRLRLTGHDA